MYTPPAAICDKLERLAIEKLIFWPNFCYKLDYLTQVILHSVIQKSYSM